MELHSPTEMELSHFNGIGMPLRESPVSANINSLTSLGIS